MRINTELVINLQRKLNPLHTIIIIIIIIIIVSFMQGIHKHIPETNHIPRGHIVTAILSLLFMVPLFLVPALVFCSFTLALSEVCVQCPIWLFSITP